MQIMTHPLRIKQVLEILAHSYRDWDRPLGDPESTRDTTIEFLDDALYNAPALATLKKFLRLSSDSSDCPPKNCTPQPLTEASHQSPPLKGRVYFYVFESPSDLGGSGSPVKGHGQELEYVFGYPLVEKSPKSAEATRNRLMSERVMKYWTNFVHNGLVNLWHFKNNFNVKQLTEMLK